MNNEVSPEPATQDHLPPPLEWPRIRWRINMWATLASLILSIIAFLLPGLIGDMRLSQSRLIVVFALLLLIPLLVSVPSWLLQTSKVAVDRVYHYPAVHMKAQQAIHDIEQLRERVSDLAKQYANEKYFEIIKAGYYDGALFVVVRKKRTPKVNQGDTFVVVHTDDNLHMGTFQVTEIRSQELYATATSYIDPVWSGYIRQQGEVEINPYLRAIHMPQER